MSGQSCTPTCKDGFSADQGTMLRCQDGYIQDSFVCLADCDLRDLHAPGTAGTGDCGTTLKSGNSCRPQCSSGSNPSGHIGCNDGSVMNNFRCVADCASGGSCCSCKCNGMDVPAASVSSCDGGCDCGSLWPDVCFRAGSIQNSCHSSSAPSGHHHHHHDDPSVDPSGWPFPYGALIIIFVILPGLVGGWVMYRRRNLLPILPSFITGKADPYSAAYHNMHG